MAVDVPNMPSRMCKVGDKFGRGNEFKTKPSVMGSLGFGPPLWGLDR